MSLIVHPAPRMMKDPVANNAQSLRSGSVVDNPSGVVARAVDHKQGCKRRKVPMGLSSRARCAYGWRDLGR